MTLFDRIVFSTPQESRENQVRMNNLCAAIYMSCQGIPFIHAGEELLRSKGFDHNSYKSPDSVNSIKWIDLEKDEVRSTLAYYKGLIAIRKAYAPLRRGKVVPFGGMPEQVAAYRVSYEEEEMLLIFNASKSSFSLPLPEGSWRILALEQSANVQGLGIAQDQLIVAAISSSILVKEV